MKSALRFVCFVLFSLVSLHGLSQKNIKLKKDTIQFNQNDFYGSMSDLHVKNRPDSAKTVDSLIALRNRLAAVGSGGGGLSAIDIIALVMANGVTVTPPAPTGGTVDDGANTFTFTPAIGHLATVHEYSTNNGSSYTSALSNVISVGDVAIASGSFKVRVAAGTNRNAGAVLASTSAFTSSSSSVPLISAFSLSSSINNYGEGLGCHIVVGAADVVATDLGRYIQAGNTQVHTIQIRASDGVTVLASATLDASAKTPGAFGYTAITPITLTAGSSYFIICSETNGGDNWYNWSPGGVTINSAFSAITEAYETGGTAVNALDSGTAYGPVNLIFHL